MAAPTRQPSAAQPAPFGCRLVVIVIIASFLFGLLGSVVGSRLTGTQPRVAPTAQTNDSQPVTAEGLSVVEAAKKVSPTVVSLTTETTVQTFLGPSDQKSGGTGFIITNDGLIATNKHVVEKATKNLVVVTNDGKSYPAEVKALDPTLDFALIKIDAKNLPVATLGNSDTLQVGQPVIAIGNALGEYQNTVTSGVISAKARTIQAGDGISSAEQLDNLLQTDAAINPGNSGGPLVNLAGQVIGVNTAVAGDAQGIGFAIPINAAKNAIDSFTTQGRIVRAGLGVRYVTVTKELARLNKLPVDYGVLLTTGRGNQPAVTANSPAAQAGLRDGDLIVAINGTKIDESRSLPSVIGQFKPGDEIEVTYLRDGKEQKIRVRLTERTD